jgi:hypothetical protein
MRKRFRHRFHPTTLYYPTHIMVLKLYGHPMSTCTKRVAVVLKKTNTPFDLEVVDLSRAFCFITAPPFAMSSL